MNALSQGARAAGRSGASAPRLAWQVHAPAFPKREISITHFGAVGDGLTLNTKAFARAVAALADQGGGRLDVPPGIWLTGPIRLRSHINLHLERGALLQFSGDYKLYPLTVLNLHGEKEVASTSPLSGESLKDVAITGSGVIDGGGHAWRPVKRSKLTERAWKDLVRSGGVVNKKGDIWWPSREAMTGAQLVGRLRREGSLNLKDYEPAHQFLRPKLLRLINCQNVLLKGVTFQNPPSWTLNPEFCTNVLIEHVTVHNAPSAQNSDGLDLESCRRAVVRGCTFDVGDDGICLKSGKNAAGRRIGIPTQDVLIKNCVVYHAHGGFTIGSEMSGGVRDVVVNNCLFMGTDVGLRFKSTRGRGGVVENVHISNVRMKDIAGAAISFNMYYGGHSPLAAKASPSESHPPPVTVGTPQFRNISIDHVICRGAKTAIVLEGLPEMPIRDIHLRDVSITARTGAFLMDAIHISLDQVEILNQSGAAVNVFHTTDSVFNHLSCSPGATAFVSATGKDNRDISIRNTDLKAAKTEFTFHRGATRGAFRVR